MAFERYIEYNEYLELGGKVSEDAFVLLERKAQRWLDYFTFDRVNYLTRIPDEVKEVLAQADEIYVPYEERSRIADLAHNYDVDILLGAPKDIDISELKQLKTLAKDRLVIDLFTYEADIYALLKENGFEFVYHFPILTFASFKELVHRGVKYITIDRQLILEEL